MCIRDRKLTALAFVWLCSIVSWGHAANIASVIGKCTARCGFQVTIGVVSWVYTSVLLVLNYLTESDRLSRTGCFSHGMEVQLMAALIILWIPGVGAASVADLESPSSVVSIWFAWLAFFGSIFTTYKAYHSFKEEDLPSALPEGFDEEDYVYG